MEWKATESATNVLLAVASDELGNLRPEARVNLAIALGIVGKKVDGREFDRLQESPGFLAGRAFRRSSTGADAVLHVGPVDRLAVGRGMGRGQLGHPDLVDVDLQPVGQPGAELLACRGRRAR